MNSRIAQAARGHLVAVFSYHGLPRTVEPHTYGMDRDGDEVLVAYQVAGGTQSGKVPGWRIFKISDIRGLQVTDETFFKTRPGYNRYDSRFNQIYARA